MSTTVDVSDSLDEARTRLLKTARALNGAWAAALCSMGSLVVASLALLLVAANIRPVYVVIWSVLLAATSFNLTRFWPRRRPRAGLLLSRQEADALRTAVDPDGRLAWPAVVRLVPQAELELAEGELALGMPLLACLDPAEIRQLLQVAAVQASVEDERMVRWALRVAHGDIGRPLVGRRPRLKLADLAADRGAPRPGRPARRGPRQLGGGLRTCCLRLLASERGRDVVPGPDRRGVGADAHRVAGAGLPPRPPGHWRRSPRFASSSRVRTPPAG